MKARLNNTAGFYAENSVETELRRAGKDIHARRWRCRHGEIDLIIREPDGFVFVEVKKSSSHAAAAARVTRAQMRRIMHAAQEFMAKVQDCSRPNMRFDVATVDSVGRVECLENAFGMS